MSTTFTDGRCKASNQLLERKDKSGARGSVSAGTAKALTGRAEQQLMDAWGQGSTYRRTRQE